jgi:glycosyltransferase 2 family protein
VTAASVRSFVSRYKVPLIAAKILLSVALFAYVVAKVSPKDIWATTRRADPTLLLVSAGLLFFSNLVGSWLWARLLRARGVDIPYRKAASYYFVGLFFNNFLPSNIGGDIARISDASKHATHVSPVFSATLMDRLIGVLSIAFVAVLASFAAIDRLHMVAIYATIFLVFLVALGLFLSIFSRKVLMAFEWPFRVVGARGIEAVISRLMDDLHGFKNQGSALVVAIAASTLVQITRILVHYTVGLALGVRVAMGSYFLFVPVLAALVSLPISLNGLGIREGAGVVLFQMAGMTNEQAFTVPFLTYLISVVISLLGGLIFLSRTPRRALQTLRERKKAAREGAEVGRATRRTG